MNPFACGPLTNCVDEFSGLGEPGLSSLEIVLDLLGCGYTSSHLSSSPCLHTSGHDQLTLEGTGMLSALFAVQAELASGGETHVPYSLIAGGQAVSVCDGQGRQAWALPALLTKSFLPFLGVSACVPLCSPACEGGALQS